MNIVLTGTHIEQDTTQLGFQKNNLIDMLVVTVDTDESWQYKLDVRYAQKDSKGEEMFNVIDLNRSGQVCTALLTLTMLPLCGKYTMQLRGIKGQQVWHSDTFYAWVKYSIDPGEVYNPVPSEFYQVEYNITELNNHPPYPDISGFWKIYNVEKHEYELSDIPVPTDGGMDKTFEFTQSTPSDVWVIRHGLYKHPSVTVTDSGGNEVVGEVEYIDMNVVKVTFASVFRESIFELGGKLNEFLTNLNLNRNELQNAVIQPLAVAPSSPKAGQIYYNSGDKFIYRFDGDNWSPIGVVYIQGSTAGAVITGLDGTGKVTTTNVVGLQLAGYTPVEGGYVSNNMTMQQAIAALDTAVKNAVAGGGEVNQNAWSNITVPTQSTNDSTEVVGQGAAATISANSKTDTFTIASGDKWTHVAADKTAKKVTVGHAFSGATAGNYGDATHVAKVAIDNAGHVTNAESVEIVGAEYITTLTSDAQTQLNAKVPNTRKVNNKALNADITLDAGDVGADAAGSAAAVLGTSADDSDKATVYGARALAQKGIDAATNALGVANGKVASVNNADTSIVIGGTGVDPNLKVNVSTDADNALKLTTNGLKVVVPDGAEYSMVKLAQARDGYLASYQMTKDGTNIGEVINIPKDYLVKSAEVKTSTGTGDPSGFPAGTKYIDFTVNTYDTETGTGTESHIYLDVQSLVDVYTNGNGISISDSNVISAKVVANNGLSLTANGITMAAAAASNAGAMSAAHYTKLEGIESGATKNSITLNGTANANPSFYAPTGVGTNGQILVSSGSGAPTWKTAPERFHKYTAQNATLSARSGAFTWSITAATHGVANSSMLVQLYEVATGAQVMADVVVNQTNFNITITINDVAGAGTLSANTYKVVVIG